MKNQLNLILVILLFSQCKVIERRSEKLEDEYTKVTFVKCQKCSTHTGEFIIFEIKYKTILIDSLKNDDILVKGYFNFKGDTSKVSIQSFHVISERDKKFVELKYYTKQNRIKRNLIEL